MNSGNWQSNFRAENYPVAKKIIIGIACILSFAAGADAQHGQAVEPLIWPYSLFKKEPVTQKEIFIPFQLVTKENVNAFLNNDYYHY